MLFTHMDQLGFVVRKIDADGPDPGRTAGRRAGTRAGVAGGADLRRRRADVPGVIANKSHHATTPDEKYHVVRATASFTIDAGSRNADEAEAAGVHIGTPVVYRPQALELAGDRIAGTSRR